MAHMPMPRHFLEHRSITAVLALLLACIAYWGDDVVTPAILKGVLGIQHISTIMPDGHKAQAWWPFTVFYSVRCAWYLFCFGAMSCLPGFTLARATLVDRLRGRRLAWGFGIGTLVMGGSILLIILAGQADVAYVQASTPFALAYALGWVATSLIGALAEEVMFRGLIYGAVDKLAGRAAAIVVSAAAFSWSHTGNDGASTIWLVRLFLQGLLLAYAVHRTGSLWWPTGYHAGWNWASAPFFGAVGSGYANQGHFLTFTPTGSVWMTGGAAGPEGSVLAFAAMGVAYWMLMRCGRRAVPSSC